MTTTLAGATTPAEVTTGVTVLEAAAKKIQDKLANDIKHAVIRGQKAVAPTKSPTESGPSRPSTTTPGTLPATVARHCGAVGTLTCGPDGTSVCAAADACKHTHLPEPENIKHVEFTTENALSLMSNPKFMEVSGQSIEEDIAGTVQGYRT